MNKSRWQLLVGVIMTVFGLIALVVSSIISVVMRFMNPDMTQYRFILEYPALSICGLIFGLIVYIGLEIAKYAAENDKDGK